MNGYFYNLLGLGCLYSFDISPNNFLKIFLFSKSETIYGL